MFQYYMIICFIATFFVKYISCCSILLRGFFLHNGKNEWLGNSTSLGKEFALLEEGTAFDAVSAGRKGGRFGGDD